MAHVLISAAHKSSGKTTVSIGLCAAVSRRGTVVQPFKKGPDYIDPMWLGQASGRACYNLDFYTMSRAEIGATFAARMAGAELGLIEANKGLYDGLDLDGSNSNAALAVLLQAPVVLVIDARGMTRGVAPLILGYQAFDPQVNIAGIILNKLGGRRHESKLRAVIEHYTDVPVLGAVLHDPVLEIKERHLGLIPSNESAAAARQIGYIADAVADQVDLQRLQAIGATAPVVIPPLAAPAQTHTGLRIGIMRDSAFGFYYPGDLDAMRAAGVELVFINALSDPVLPAVDGLFIGGGFPETHLPALHANSGLRSSLRQAIDGGLPVYAECGGLMYLCRRISWRGDSREMVGALPADVVMTDTPKGRGYVRLQGSVQHPWPGMAATEIAAHEFHYSTLENLDPGLQFAYAVRRGTGIDGRHDGLIYRNVLASYTHLRDTGLCHWVGHFLDFVASRTVRRARN